jgi:soluble lytic murein transglycosylase
VVVGEVFEPSRVTLVLDDPRLVPVRQAAAQEQWPKAAQAMSAAIAAAGALTPEDRRAWLYQLGRLRGLAGDPAGAAQAYDSAAAEPWALADHARFAAAQWLGKAGQHDAALVRARAVTPGLGIAGDLEVVLAEALAGKGEIDAAAERWRAYLAREKRGYLWPQVALRFARALLAHPSAARAEEAVTLAERVIYDAPGGAGADEARKVRGQAISTLPFPKRKRFDSPTPEDLVARARALQQSGQAREALRVADLVVVGKPKGQLPARVECDAASIRADALGKLRKKPEAADVWAEAVKKCEGDARATALYNGARASWQAERVPEAMLRYAQLEKEFPRHNLADDARVKGAKAAKEHGDETKHAELLTSMPAAYPEGDMLAEGLFELALSKIEKRDWAGAVAPLERGAALPRERAYHSAGRFAYYLGRARMETGAAQQGVEQLIGVVGSYPLSYYMALAHARLAEHDPAVAARALEEAVRREPPGEFTIPRSKAFAEPAFARAVELSRQGEPKLARAELDLLGVSARTAPPEVLWAGAFLLSRAGSPQQSHGLLRSATNRSVAGRIEATDWTEHYPVGRWRTAWELAYPRPFADLVTREARKNGIGEALVYGIMREESAFDARVMSPANAVGLMQLIVPTAKTMAKPLSLPSDVESLKRPEVNVALGCRFLSQLRTQFSDNPLLAIPGYNAGGGAPKRWIGERPSQDFDVWVERIPYEETRLYTKRVINSMAAYEFLYPSAAASEALRTPRAASPAARGAVPTAATP